MEIYGIQLEDRQIQDLQLYTPWTGLVLSYVCMYVYVGTVSYPLGPKV